MKIVIDIPKEMIEAAKTDLWCGSPTVGYAISHGTPFEERQHGEWIFTGRYNVYGCAEIECSNCHNKTMISMNQWIVGKKFCDVCGSQNKK